MSSTPRIPPAQRQLFQRAYDKHDDRKAWEFAETFTRRYPADAFGWHALAKLYYQRNALDEALAASQQACELGADEPPKTQAAYWLLCGRLSFELENLPEAEKALVRTAELASDDSEPLLLLGHTYHRQGRNQLAIEALDQALEMSPQSANILATRIMVFSRARHYSTVMRDCRALMALKPTKASYYNLVGAKYNELGDFKQAQYYYREAVKRDPGFFGAASNAITGLHYDPDVSAEQIHAEILTWQAAFAGEPRPPVPSDTRPHRQLRIGLISPGFNMHPVGQMIQAGMLNIKRANLELYYYNLDRKRDPVTLQLMRSARHWKDVYAHSQDELESLLRADALDILIDLTGHNDQNQLPLISSKPAPLILKWVGGQINTVGLDAIDYFLSDHIETPLGVDNWYVEKLIRLPDDYICYSIPSYSPSPGDLPALANDYVTLGCLNNLTKINPQLLAHWARLMQALPGSHLILKGPQCEDEDYCQGLRNQLAEHGVAPERLELQGPSLHKAFMTTYQQIDIALDPWPYSGGLTTCEALAMGVPVVTMPGPTFAGRHAATHLINAGLPDLVVDSWEGYQQRVLDLASDLPALAELRANLRERLRRSPLCDGKRFAENFDGALRAIWQRYCAGKTPAALDFIGQGECRFEDEAAPVELQHPAPYLSARQAAERRFSWQLPGKLVVIDNSAKLLRQDGIDRLLQLDAFGIVAFDPGSRVEQPERFANSADVQLLPHAVLGDGQSATLHACLEPEFSSTLKPLPAEQLLPAQRQGAQVLAKLPISTVALNSVAGLESLDWLVLDHLSDASTILEHGDQALKDSLLIQVRIAFQPTHQRQPTLAELQHWMARQGFRFYRFNDMAYESHLPTRNDLVKTQSTELTSADVLFLPNQARMAALSDPQRLKLAFLLHTVFNIRDLTHELLAEVDEDKAEDYLLAQGMLSIPEEELRNAKAADQLSRPEDQQAGRPLPKQIGNEQSAEQAETKQDDESEFIFD